jgi:ABC-2 type transport system permease protein
LRLFARADLSEGNLFSVSESTREVLSDLDDVINIKVYFSKKLPPYLATLTRGIRDMLDEYRAYAGKNLIISLEDPADDPETEQRVRSLGIPQVQLNIIEKDKAEVMNGYLGIAVLFADRKEIIPVVQSTVNLEYDLTSAIVKVTSKEQRTVGFLSQEGGPDIDDEYANIARSLEKQYVVKPVTTDGGQLIPGDVKTLVVAAPRALSAWDRFAADQFLMRGGSVLFLVEMIEIVEGTLTGVKVHTGIDSLLAHYGVVVRQDLVVDRTCASATFSTGFLTYTLPYPLWPMVVGRGFDADSPITNQLERAVLPWASSIEIEEAASESLEVSVLVRSSPQSWSEERQFRLDPQQSFTPMTETGSRDLAVLMTGRFGSYFMSKPVPIPEGSEEAPDVPVLDRSQAAHIVVVGNSRFIQTDFLGQFPENSTFFLNAVDWLTLGDSLIGIRSRRVTSRPLKELGEQAKSTIRFASTFGIPIVLITWGLLRRYLRSGRRRQDIW